MNNNLFVPRKRLKNLYEGIKIQPFLSLFSNQWINSEQQVQALVLISYLQFYELNIENRLVYLFLFQTLFDI